MIPLIFVIAPLAITYVDNYAQWVYEQVDTTGKEKIDTIRSNYDLMFYVLPIVFTNGFVIALYYIYNWYYNRTQYTTENLRKYYSCQRCGVPLNGKDKDETDTHCGFCSRRLTSPIFSSGKIRTSM